MSEDRYRCPEAGWFKVAGEHHVTPILCAAHAKDWDERFPGGHMIMPRRVGADEPTGCLADWMLPSEERAQKRRLAEEEKTRGDIALVERIAAWLEANAMRTIGESPHQRVDDLTMNKVLADAVRRRFGRT